MSDQETTEETTEEGTVTTVHFNMSGAWFAEFMRTRYAEGAWDGALRLGECIEGLSIEDTIAIIKGEKTFLGEAADPGGITLHPGSTKLKKQMEKITDRLYGNIFEHRGKYWEPYARVVGPWTNEDYTWALDRKGEHAVSPFIVSEKDNFDPRKALLQRRSLYYANDPAKDMMVIFEQFVEGDAENGYAWTILCKHVEKPPFWIKCSVNDPIDFLRQRVIAKKFSGRWNRLESRGGYIDTDIAEAVRPAGAKEKDRTGPVDEVEIATETMNNTVKNFLAELNKAATPEEIGALERKYDEVIDSVHKKAHGVSDEIWDQHSENHKRSRQAIDAMFRKEINEQAQVHGGFLRLELKKKDGTPFSPRFVEVAKNPFILWCLRGFDFERNGKEEPVWKNVAPHSYKQMMDDRNHTDFLLSGGADLNEPYHAYGDDEVVNLGQAIMAAAWNIRHATIEEWTKADFSFLSKPKDCWNYYGGAVVMPKPGEKVKPGSIAVIPHAGVEYDSVLRSINKGDERGVIICDVGGKLAHMAVVGRELDVLVIMVPDATKKYREEQRLSIDPKTMTITQHL